MLSPGDLKKANPRMESTRGDSGVNGQVSPVDEKGKNYLLRIFVIAYRRTEYHWFHVQKQKLIEATH